MGNDGSRLFHHPSRSSGLVHRRLKLVKGRGLHLRYLPATRRAARGEWTKVRVRFLRDMPKLMGPITSPRPRAGVTQSAPKSGQWPPQGPRQESMDQRRGAETVSFGAWVRKRRRALDLTQARLGELAACTESAIRKIETDERRPSRRIAERLADALKIPAAERAKFIETARGPV